MMRYLKNHLRAFAFVKHLDLILLSISVTINIILLFVFIHRPYFWDELLYVWLAWRVRQDPSLLVDRSVARWVPHPPLFWYYLAATWILPVRLSVFILHMSLIILLFFVLRRYSEKNPWACLAVALILVNPLVVQYNFTIFNDLASSITTVISTVAYVTGRKYKKDKWVLLSLVFAILTGLLKYLYYFLLLVFIASYELLGLSGRDFRRMSIILMSACLLSPLYYQMYLIARGYRLYKNPIYFVSRSGFWSYMYSILTNIYLIALYMTVLAAFHIYLLTMDIDKFKEQPRIPMIFCIATTLNIAVPILLMGIPWIDEKLSTDLRTLFQKYGLSIFYFERIPRWLSYIHIVLSIIATFAFAILIVRYYDIESELKLAILVYIFGAIIFPTFRDGYLLTGTIMLILAWSRKAKNNTKKVAIYCVSLILLAPCLMFGYASYIQWEMYDSWQIPKQP